MGLLGCRALQLLCGVGLVVGLAGTASAQEEVELSPVIVKSMRTGDEPVQEGTKTSIDAQVLDRRMAQSFEDIGRRVDAGVNFDSTTKSINLRGLQNDRVLTTVDGIRVPWLVDPRGSAQGGLNAFDFDQLTAIDILRGADSSRYGSGALGGVVQLRTLDPEDLIAPGRSFGGLAKSGYDSADESWRVNGAVAGRVDDTWLLVQGGYRRGHETENFGTVDGYGATRTVPNPRDYDQASFLAKLHQYFGDGHRLGLTGEIARREDDIQNFTGTTGSYVPGSFRSGESVDRRRISADYQYRPADKSGPLDAANLTLYWLDQKLDATVDAERVPDGRGFIIPGDPFFYGRPFGPYSRDNWIRQKSLGVVGDAEEEVTIGGLSNTFRFGGEIYGQTTTQYSAGVDNCPDVDWSTIPQPFGPQSCRFLHSNAADMPEVRSTIGGLFVENAIRLVDDRLTITPGIRFDAYEHRPRSTAEFEASPGYDPAYLASNSDFGVSPKLRINYEVTPELSAFAQYSRGFRAPSARELYENFANSGQYARIGNPTLETETSNGFEIGAAYETASYGMSANVFYNDYRNFIDEVVLPPTAEYPLVFSYENLSRVRIYGAEIRAHAWFADYWKAWGSLAYANGRDRDTGNYLNSVPPLKAIIGLGYQRETWGADISTTLAARRDKVSGEGTAAGFVAPGYGVVDMTAWWSPEQVPGMQIRAGIYNLFDKKYWNAIEVPEGRTALDEDRFTEPGRSFRIELTQRF